MPPFLIVPKMLLILFGTKDRRKVEGAGQFICPKCGVKRDYEVISLRQWVTLFLYLLFQQKISRGGNRLWNVESVKSNMILT